MVKKVLIVDDSAMIRELLTEMISSFSDYEVVGSAANPIIAAEKIDSLSPDILTLDINMPKMDGITFLEKIMRLRPIPVLMISSLTSDNSELTLKALELGAIDYIEKPNLAIKDGLQKLSAEIQEKLDSCSRANISKLVKIKILVEPKYHMDEVIVKQKKAPIMETDKIIAIGASTGGTGAILEILKRFPSHVPGIVVVQHMPAAFTGPFAKRLNGQCTINVKEATDYELIAPGTAYLAPGGKHLMISRKGSKYYLVVSEGKPVNRHIPSVDVLFRSVAQEAGKNAIGVILTGMGEDGAKGLLEMKESGAYTIAQDESSSIVFGMPKAAIEIGATSKIFKLNEIPLKIYDFLD